MIERFAYKLIVEEFAKYGVKPPANDMIDMLEFLHEHDRFLMIHKFLSKYRIDRAFYLTMVQILKSHYHEAF